MKGSLWHELWLMPVTWWLQTGVGAGAQRWDVEGGTGSGFKRAQRRVAMLGRSWCPQ